MNETIVTKLDFLGITTGDVILFRIVLILCIIVGIIVISDWVKNRKK